MVKLDIVLHAKAALFERIEGYGKDPYGTMTHVPLVEKWAKFLLKYHPEADSEIVLLGVWLHDIGHYPLDEADHAVKGEALARKFLEQENYPTERREGVLHCVRAHRCRDVMPGSLEAKIVACADSASHMVDYIYIDIARNGRPKEALEKIERDFRDLKIFPETEAALRDIYLSWKKLIEDYIRVADNLG